MCSQITGQTGQKEGLSSQAWRQMTDVTHELFGGVHSLSSTQCVVWRRVAVVVVVVVPGEIAKLVYSQMFTQIKLFLCELGYF